MNTFEIVILALALVFSSWMSYLNAGIALASELLVRKVYYMGIMFLLQFCMAGTGVWVGYKAGSSDMQINMTISLSILLILGLKILFTGIRNQAPEKKYDYLNNKVILIAALTEGIAPLAVGVAIGLVSLQPYLHWILTGVFLFSGILAGVLLSKNQLAISSKIKLAQVGGLLLLAAAIKLMLNLTGF
jgi:putative Mn2+ efflux pump MntP